MVAGGSTIWRDEMATEQKLREALQELLLEIQAPIPEFKSEAEKQNKRIVEAVLKADSALSLPTQAEPVDGGEVVYRAELNAVKAEFNRAIDFAIKEGIGAGVFLDAWRHGDTNEWPEFIPIDASQFTQPASQDQAQQPQAPTRQCCECGITHDLGACEQQPQAHDIGNADIDALIEPLFHKRKGMKSEGTKDDWYWYAWGAEDYAKTFASQEQPKLLCEAADELAWLHHEYMVKSPDSEGVPRIIRLIQKIEQQIGYTTKSPYPQAASEEQAQQHADELPGMWHTSYMADGATDCDQQARGAWIKATLHHDAGAYAQCGDCGRYSDDPKTLSNRPPACDCGETHSWSGSFKTPDQDAKWSNHNRAALAAKQEQAEPAAQEAVCGACNGSGRVPRDPDIGTDQECFACDGSGLDDSPQPAPASAELPDEQAAFEAAAVELGWPQSSVGATWRADENDYSSSLLSNGWGFWKARAVLSAQVAPPESDKVDAARWRAFVGCARIRFFGWAGYEETDPNGNSPGNYRHFGAEFWTIHEAPTSEHATRILEGFADAAIAARAAAKD